MPDERNRATLVYERVGPGVYTAAFCPIAAGPWTVTFEMPPEPETRAPHEPA